MAEEAKGDEIVNPSHPLGIIAGMVGDGVGRQRPQARELDPAYDRVPASRVVPLRVRVPGVESEILLGAERWRCRRVRSDPPLFVLSKLPPEGEPDGEAGHP